MPSIVPVAIAALIALALIALVVWRDRRRSPDFAPGLPSAPSLESSARLSARDILDSVVANAARDVVIHRYDGRHEAAEAHQSKNNVPQKGIFVGRGDLLSRIEERLRQQGAFGVTSLKGAAGVGKSALAIEAAHRFAGLFPDGRYWLDLRGGNPAEAVRGLLLQLGLVNREQLAGGFHDLCGMMRDALSGKRVLLVIDNAEGLANAAKDQLLALCLSPPASTLITSRVTIDTATDIRVDVLIEEDALDLLDRRGVAVSTQVEDARRLVNRLGRLALALRITADRISHRGMSCRQALEQLEEAPSLVEKLKLPAQNNIDDNVAESFALSYQMLNAELQTAFHALGLCDPAGSSVEALARMLDTTTANADDLAMALDHFSLCEIESGDRIEIHPLLHDYARSRAAEQPAEMKETIVRHVRYFAGEIGGEYQRTLNDDRGHQASDALDRADREFANVRLAQIRALAPDFSQPELAVEITGDLRQYWRLRDDPDLLNWLLSAQSLAKKTKQKQREANVLQAIGDVQSFRDEKDAALNSYLEAQSLFKQVGDNLGQANVLQAIGDVQSFRKEMDAALNSYLEAQSLFKQVGSNLGQANVLQAIGDVQSFRDEKDAALRSYLEAQSLFKQVGSNLGQANVLKAIGDVQSFRKEMDAALNSYLEAQSLFKQVGDNLGQANVLQAIGDVQSFRDEKDAALNSYLEAQSLFKQVGSNLGQANVLKAIGDVQSFRDEKDAALNSYLEAQSLFKQVGDNLGQANVLQAIGDVQSFRKEMDAALNSYLEAQSLFKQVGSNLGQANVLQAIGDVQSFRKEMDAALNSYLEAQSLFKQVGSNLGQANVLKAIGDVQSFRKEMDAALNSYLEAQSLFKQVGSNLGQANVLQAIGDVQSFRDEKDAALNSYLEAQSLFKQVGSNLGQANVLKAIGDVQSFRKEMDAALNSYLEAQSLFKQVGSNLGQANVLQAIGDVQSFRDEKDAALNSYLEAQSLFKQVGSNLGQANVLKAIGDVQSFRKEMDAALNSYLEAQSLFKQVGSNLGQANVLLALGRMNDDPESFESALALYQQIGDRYSTARCQYFFGLSRKEAGDRERARQLLTESREGSVLTYPPRVELIDQELAELDGVPGQD